jgi:hypothetical protein
LGTGTLAGTLTFENNASLVQLNDAAKFRKYNIRERSLEKAKIMCTGLPQRSGIG